MNCSNNNINAALSKMLKITFPVKLLIHSSKFKQNCTLLSKYVALIFRLHQMLPIATDDPVAWSVSLVSLS